jgi:protocatechuate 3,4-dioxygenase beta subunit
VNAQTGADGSFEFADVQPGTYTLEVVPLRTAVVKLGGRADVIVTNKDIDDVSLRLRPPSIVSGTMRLEGGDIKSLIPEGSASRLASDIQAVNDWARAVQMSQRGSLPPNMRPSVELQSTTPGLGGTGLGFLQEDGTFRIDTVRPGQYRFRVELLPEGVYVKAARSAGLNVLLDPLDLTEGDSTLDIVLSATAGEVSGFVRNERGEPEANVTVTLWPTVAVPGRPYSGTISTITDQTGSYRLRRIPPGDYHLAAWNASDRGLLSSHAFLTLFNSRTAKVEVEEGARLTVEAKVMPAEVVRQELAKLP